MLKLIAAALFIPLNAFAGGPGGGRGVSLAGFSYPIAIPLNAGAAGKVCFETPLSEIPSEDYDTVLMQGVMPDPGLRLDVIGGTAGPGGTEAAYERVGFNRFPNGRFWARFQAAAPGRSPVRLSVTDLGMKAGSTLLIYETELLMRDAMAEEPAGAPQAQAAPDVSVPPSAPFRLVRRAEWKAKPPKEAYTRHTPRLFTLHHTQAHYPATYGASLEEMRFLQDYHQNGNGWNDIGYHFLIDRLGNIFEGRPIGVLGSHVKNRNTDNVGISLMGSFHPPANDTFTPAARDSVAAVGSYLKDNYSIKAGSFYAHRDIGSTDCPGDGLYPKMGLLRQLIFDPQAPAGLPVPPGATPAQSESLRQLLLSLEGR